MKNLAVFTALILAAAVLVSCTPEIVSPAQTDTGVVTGAVTTAETENDTVPSDVEKLTDPVDDSKTAKGDFTVTPGEGAGEVTVSGNVYTITKAGEYTDTEQRGDKLHDRRSDTV